MRHRVEDDQCGFRQLQGENRSFYRLQVDPLERDLSQQLLQIHRKINGRTPEDLAVIFGHRQFIGAVGRDLAHARAHRERYLDQVVECRLIARGAKCAIVLRPIDGLESFIGGEHASFDFVRGRVPATNQRRIARGSDAAGAARMAQTVQFAQRSADHSRGSGRRLRKLRRYCRLWRPWWLRQAATTFTLAANKQHEIRTSRPRTKRASEGFPPFNCAGFQRPFRRDMEANKMSFIVFLVLTIVMPPNEPDIRHQMQEPSIEQCWADAAEFVQHGVPKVVTNGQAVMAGCLVREGPSNDS